jgi:hypothetical protein
MACKRCGGVTQQELDGELTASLPEIEKLDLPPIYACNYVMICLDCGLAEIIVPSSELEQLRKGLAASTSQSILNSA